MIYIVFDIDTKEVFYVGHTDQPVSTRIYQHCGGKKSVKGGNSKFRRGLLTDGSIHQTKFRVTAIKSHPSRVRRLEQEQQWIDTLQPTWNVQREHHWWTKHSYEEQDADA